MIIFHPGEGIMLNNSDNIFATFSHYCAAEEENFLTESFAYLLKRVCRIRPDAAAKLINKITGSLPVHPIEDMKTVKISTQRFLGKYGTVDMAIEEVEDTLVLIEIKHDSPLGPKQLQRYCEALSEENRRNSRLILLKRHKDVGSEVILNTSQFHLVTWYEVHKWLSDIKKDDDVLAFLIKEFQTFLEEKNMKLKKVSWEYIQGVPALFELRNLLEAAKNEILPKLPLARTQSWSWVGLYIDKNFFFGLRYDKPLMIVYENNFGKYPTSKTSLDLEEKHFFSLNADEQLTVLMEFLKQASKEVKRGKEESVPPEKENSN
jgi:hypothetical protein